MEVFRITLPRYKALIPKGREARWNSKGVNMIYSASSRSLACLENVVHRSEGELSVAFEISVIHIPGSISIERINLSSLPYGWHESGIIPYGICRQIGDKWVSEGNTAVLEVPSAIVNNEKNFLINVRHPDFSKIQVVETEPFFFDPRIKL
jgi:RES domain-containing protein